MAYNRTKMHEDMSLFCNRLWGLMNNHTPKLTTAKELATALYTADLVHVSQKENFNSLEVNRANAIGSVEKKIQAHLRAPSTDHLQGEFVTAYCKFFGCSADYLFGNTDIESGNEDVRHFCECTGLSEKAVKRLIEDIPLDIKKDLIGFWSNVLDSNVFYGIPMEFHQMCYELGQYQTAQNMIRKIKAVSREIDNADTFVETWQSMMEDNYLKEAQPHEGAYHMHLNEILVNLTEYLEKWAEEYTERNRREIDDFFFDKLHEKHQKSHDEFLQHMTEMSSESDEPE